MLSWLKKVLGGGTAEICEVPRNAPCPCGSGKKYKRCCQDGVEERARAHRADANVAADNLSNPPASRAGVADRALRRANNYKRLR
jgi:hypothetical protein